MTTQASIAAVERTITVNCSVEHAFETVTARIGDWWPVHRYSISVDEDGTGVPAGVVMEPRVGGRLYERSKEGEELDWGKVLAWQPPHRLVLEWRPSRKPATPTEVEIRFTPARQGTRVDLEHRGWERLGAGAEQARAGYAGGWQTVIDLYKAAAENAEQA